MRIHGATGDKSRPRSAQGRSEGKAVFRTAREFAHWVVANSGDEGKKGPQGSLFAGTGGGTLNPAVLRTAWEFAHLNIANSVRSRWLSGAKAKGPRRGLWLWYPSVDGFGTSPWPRSRDVLSLLTAFESA